jgi:lysophospholipase L1-like esterase
MRPIPILLLWSISWGAFLSAAEPIRKPVKIITLGDSITKGVRTGVAAEETFAALLQAELRKRKIAAEITNVGIGGERTDQALQRLEKDVIAQEPQLVTIMYGTNDSYVDQGEREPRLTQQQFRDNLAQIVKQLKAAHIQPIVMTEPRWSTTAKANGAGEHPNLRLEKYVQQCREVAAELDVPLVDHFAHWTKQEKEGQDLDAWTTDTCHPNPQGHKQLSDLLLPVVVKKTDSQ